MGIYESRGSVNPDARQGMKYSSDPPLADYAEPTETVKPADYNQIIRTFQMMGTDAPGGPRDTHHGIC